MTSKPLLKALLCMGIPLVILVGMSITPLLTLLLGQEIAIKTKPVDPRDVFRGDHVILSYEINELAIDQVPPVFKEEERWQDLRQAPLYVILKKDGTVYVVDHAVLEKPRAGVYLKGWAEYAVWSQSVDIQGSQSITGIQVSYNLDQYFVPENTGTSLEYLSQRGQLTALVKVWRGYATLVDVRP